MKTWEQVKGELTSLTDEDLEIMEFHYNLVNEIVKRRNELNLSQRNLAKMCGIKYSAIARMESFGAIPQIDTLYKIIKPLGLIIKLERE